MPKRKGSKRRSRSFPRWLTDTFIFNQWGRLLLLSTTLVVLWLAADQYIFREVYPLVRDDILRAVGIGLFPLSTWALLFLGVLRINGRWLLRTWQWWLASALAVAAGQTVLGAIHGPDGILATATLGGALGHWLWKAWWQGVPLALGLVILAWVVLWPNAARRMARAGLILMGKGALALARATGKGLWAGVVALARAPRRLRARKADLAELPDDEAMDAELADRAAAEAETELAEERDEVRVVRKKAADGARAAMPAEPAGKNGQQKVKAGSIRPWRLLPLNILEEGPPARVTKEETTEVAQRIEETLGQHGVEVTVDQVKPGPTVTLYGLSPGWMRRYREVKKRDARGNVVTDAYGKPVIIREEDQSRVKVDSIVAREKDLALALAAPSLRIQAPVPGESVVGIEVPNREPVLVTVRSVMESRGFRDMAHNGGLTLALGQGSGGDPIVADLRNLPHLLIAGATGSGKSVCINALIISLAGQVSPERLRFLLIDPKRVELTPYNGLPHLVAPVVVDTEPAVRALKGMIREMKRRFRRLEELGVRNIEAYHRHPQALEPMPYLIIAVDELADLMMAATYEVEQTLTRLAQLGRATGIHLIVATQRPSVDVVTGLIKANFPSRISFAVVSQVDSRTILDAGGADRLLGKGDMLFMSNSTPKPQRIQGAYVSDREIGRFMEFWRLQDGPPLPRIDLEPDVEESKESPREDDDGIRASAAPSKDEMMARAMEVADRYSHISTSLLQRRLRIGYPRAARLMDELEEAGLIGPGEPGKTREVIRRTAES